jgi:hypothetical protein
MSGFSTTVGDRGKIPVNPCERGNSARDALALENGDMIGPHLDEAASVRQSLHHAL